MSRHSQNPNHYLVSQQRIPGYLPYPNPVGPGDIPVPNASSIDWPQAQFAPPFLPAGSKSFQDYEYPDYQSELHLAGAMGEEWAEEYRGPILFLAGLAAGYLLFSPNSPAKR